MKLDGGQLQSSQRISVPAFAALLAVLAVLALGLLYRSVGGWRAAARVLPWLSPGLCAVACAVALYYQNGSAVIARLAGSVVFLQTLMICALFLKG